MNNSKDTHVMRDIILDRIILDKGSNNTYEGKSLTEVKEYIRTIVDLNKLDTKMYMLMYVYDVTEFIRLLTLYELDKLNYYIKGYNYVKQLPERDMCFPMPFDNNGLSKYYKTMYYAYERDLANGNVYKGKTLAEIKDFIYRDKNIENTDLLYSILIHVNDIEFFLKLLSRKNLTRLEEILEETKDSKPLEEWMFS